MHNFAMFCKTYNGDLERFKNMIKSFNKFNVENITLYVSVPENDLELFKCFESDTVKIITDESYAKNYFSNEEYFGLTTGYVNQEICKLSFWETGISENYLCIDSDLEFIRDFYVSDFMADENTPYIILVQDKDLSIEKHYQTFWAWRQNLIKKIYDEIGLNDRRYRTCHGNTVLNSAVLKSLKEDFMVKKGYGYKDLIKISPYEFTWYNVWFQKCGLVKEMVVEPFFKTFHMRLDYIFYQLKLISLEDIKKAYIGIIMNSNWQKPQMKYEKPKKLYRCAYKNIWKRL